MAIVKSDNQFSLFEATNNELNDLLNLLKEKIAQKEKKEHILELFDKLIDRANFRFHAEETLLKKQKNKSLEKYKRMHNAFLSQLKDCRKDYAMNLRFINLHYLVIDIMRWVKLQRSDLARTILS